MTLSTTKWFQECGWGVMTHWLARDPDLTVDAWNRRVDAFDVDGLAEQLASVGCNYLLMTIGQLSGHYCSPNPIYDSYVGIQPSKCSQRDLIADLHAALAPRGIRLFAYLPSHGPDRDQLACERLGWDPIYLPYMDRKEDWMPAYEKGILKPKRLVAFQEKWQAVIQEWSIRWGDKISGWWIDGVKFGREMYEHDDAPNYASLIAALKSGNPNSIVGINPSKPFTPVRSATPHEDYTAGHDAMRSLNLCPGEALDEVRWHSLCFLGKSWGRGEPRFCDEMVAGYTKQIITKGGVITWDVPIHSSGLLPDAFIQQLAKLPQTAPR